MHIADGILPLAVSVAGYATTSGLTWFSLRRIRRLPDPQSGVPRAALLAAGFFVVSWIHIPIPPTSVHLLLNGLIGVLLGWYAFPAILIGLFFQAVMFQHGGLVSLGVNATLIGAPALLGHLLAQLARRQGWLAPQRQFSTGAVGFVIGATTLAMSVLLFFAVQIFSFDQIDPTLQRNALLVAVVGYLPVILIEGVLTAMVITFLARVQPDLLNVPVAPPPELVARVGPVQGG